MLLPCTFVAGRVQVATEQDFSKLQRMINYIYTTFDLGICLEAADCITIVAYIDTAYGVHNNGKGYTGSFMSLIKKWSICHVQ